MSKKDKLFLIAVFSPLLFALVYCTYLCCKSTLTPLNFTKYKTIEHDGHKFIEVRRLKEIEIIHHPDCCKNKEVIK